MAGQVLPLKETKEMTYQDTDTITYAETGKALRRLGFSSMDAQAIFEVVQNERDRERREAVLTGITPAEIRSALTSTYRDYRDSRSASRIADDVIDIIAASREPASPAPADGTVVRNKSTGNQYQKVSGGWAPVNMGATRYPDLHVTDYEIVATPPGKANG